MKVWKTNFSGLDDLVTNLINNIFDIENIESSFLDPLMKKELKNILNYLEIERRYSSIELDGFNQRLNIQWWKVFNTLENIIDFSLYSINEWQKFINIRNPRNHLLIRLHAKQILLSKEIFTLLRNGFWEWANARWRSLYENVVITAFICQNKKDVAIRYLEHVNILNYKEALKYKDNYKKLGHRWYGRDDLVKLEVIRNELLNKYWKNFDKDYWWIPDIISKDKTFGSIERLVDMTHFGPYYKYSSRSIHSSAKSFSNLWNNNSDLLLIWPSNSWLSDPIQNTAIFLMKWASFILLDFIKQPRKNIQARIITLYLIKILMWIEKWIWEECIKIQDSINLNESNSD